MNATVERVARAMCEADGFDPDSDIRQLKSGLRLAINISGPPQRWRAYTKKATAAIRAMRIPSTKAVNAGGRICSEGPSRALDIWMAMIAAELAEDDAP